MKGTLKLESDVLVGVCATVSSFFDYDTDGIGSFNPFRRTQDETRQTRLLSKVVKFDHFKTGIVNRLPRTQKLNGISVANPVFDE